MAALTNDPNRVGHLHSREFSYPQIRHTWHLDGADVYLIQGYNELEYNWSKLEFQKAVLPIKVREKGIQNVDITDEIRRKLEDTEIYLHWTSEVPEDEEDQKALMDLSRRTFQRLQEEEEDNEQLCTVQ